jgi:hypothetical protein
MRLWWRSRADASMKWAEHPNLRKRPSAPSKGREPVQRAIRRAFAASDTEVLTSSSIYDWAYVRRRRGRRKSMPFGVYSRTLRTLRTMCEPVERVPPHGAWLWRLRDSYPGPEGCGHEGAACGVREGLEPTGA